MSELGRALRTNSCGRSQHRATGLCGVGRTEAVELFVLLTGFGTVGHRIGLGEIVVRPAQLLVLVLNQLRLRNRHQHSHIS